MTDPIRSHHSLETIWLPSANDRIKATAADRPREQSATQEAAGRNSTKSEHLFAHSGG
jgi:hypothetical protein